MILLHQTLRDLWQLLDRHSRWNSGLVVLLLFISGALEMGSIFFLFGYIGGMSDLNGDLSPITRMYRNLGEGFEGAAYAMVTGAVLVGFFLVKNCVELLTSFALMRFAMKRYQRIATRLFSEFLEIRLDLIYQRGLLQSQQSLDSVALVFRNSFIPALAALSEIAILVTLFVALTFLLDPKLVILAGTLLGISTAVLLLATRRISIDLGALRVTAEKSVRKSMLEGFRGLIDIRLSESQSWVLDRYAQAADDFAQADRRSRAVNMIPRAQNELLLAGSIVVVAVFYAETTTGLQGALPVLGVMGFAGLRITAAASRLTGHLQKLRESHSARRKLMEVISEIAPDMLYGHASQGPQSYLSEDRALPEGKSPRMRVGLTVENVSFTYPGGSGPALRDVSLKIPHGSFVGFCGPSGSGKSTLALVVLGLLQPKKGEVYCDDWAILSHLRTWHRQIAFVGQTPFIAPRSVRENVAFGTDASAIDDERVWQALETAALADAIRGRKEGLGAFLGEDGVLLSGGQRQRLSIARALYRDPEVLVFDEATAALDNITEAEVSAAIGGMSGTKTVICIAHRLSTIRKCHQIHYMEDGCVIASGTYAELEQSCPPFRRLALVDGQDPLHV